MMVMVMVMVTVTVTVVIVIGVVVVVVGRVSQEGDDRHDDRTMAMKRLW